MNINTITAEDLRRMPDKEGLILQGCGGDLTEWVDGINEMLTNAGILKDGSQFENVFAFQHGELTCLLYPFDDVEIEHPGVDKTMWNLIVKKGVPTRLRRICCKELKERGGKGRIKILGVRAEESAKRQNRSVIDFSSPLGKVINLIYDWTEEDVWNFINCNLIDYCKLYNEGWDRLGCVGCPLMSYYKVERDFERYPLYMKAYINSFDRMLEYQESIGKERKTWKTGLEVFDWWVYSNAYISKKRISKYPTECSKCKYLGHKLMCEFYCDLISNKEFLKNV